MWIAGNLKGDMKGLGFRVWSGRKLWKMWWTLPVTGSTIWGLGSERIKIKTTILGTNEQVCIYIYIYIYGSFPK